jgi:hypothetical protein
MKRSLLALALLWAGTQATAQTIVQEFTAISAASASVSDMDLTQPTVEGDTLIAIPEQLSPGVKVSSVTDNAPDGGNTYKEAAGAASTCAKRSLSIWYCEHCKGGVTELKFHLSGRPAGSLNSFLEVSDLASSSVIDSTAQVSEQADNKDGRQAGPRIVTTAEDFVVARFPVASQAKGVTPELWTAQPAYVYARNLPAGTYQPTLTGVEPTGSFCMSMAAFKKAAPPPTPPQSH